MQETSIDDMVRIGMDHHQAGRMAEAEKWYRKALAGEPNHSNAINLLGIMAMQAGQLDAGIDLVRRAIAIDPAIADYHSNLGNALREKGRLDEAIAACREAVRIRPDFVEGYNSLGSALRDKRQFGEAAAVFREALRHRPDYAKAHNNLGNTLNDMGDHEGAIAAYQQAIRFQPELAEAHNNLATALLMKGRIPEAIAASRRAVQIRPNYVKAHVNLAGALCQAGEIDQAIAAGREAVRIKSDLPEAHANLGNAFYHKGELEEAIACYQRALKLRPESWETLNNLANALRDKGQVADAVMCCRKSIELKPDSAQSLNNLGCSLRDLGQIEEAIVSLRQALGLKPDYAEAFSNLGSALKDGGDAHGALAAFRRAAELKPDVAYLHSNVAYVMNFDPDFDAAAILAECRRWAERFERPLAATIQPHAKGDPQKPRLRIGYVSSDLRRHPVARFLLPLMEHHDPRRVEVFCYSGVKRPDDITERFRKSCHVFRQVAHLSDAQLAGLIRDDQIDILVDLTLHMFGSRLLSFARRPAPVQVTWLGYAGTTGLCAMDYRLTDPYLDPPGQGDEFYSEKSIRLPHTFWCYQSAEPDLPIGPLPALAKGSVTFGCLNNFAKITPAAWQLWIEILSLVRDSRLIIHSQRGSHRDRVIRQLAQSGIESNRIEFMSRVAMKEYLEQYNRIDIALDPFPQGGGTTTCDALWMGAPVVTLRGRTAVGRGGVSILSNVGLTEFIAETPQQYMSIASAMAGDLKKLSELRATLRQRMVHSPLMDAGRFAADMEDAYRQMWQHWCKSL